ncbi:LpqB family beta-propeller domain-containing protein [Actinoplanes sp. NPDC051851]|uniref:LpqB family beta-propeller domain-containing protein n=1 Tax=Actinoplanes sp. NPDC051851 TaxID=3154753 RepID=UPI00343C14BF
MNRRRVLAAAGAAGLALLGGCGIPDDTGVTSVGAGPSTGISVGDDSTGARVTREAATTDKTQFIENYLKAAAGDLDSALDRVKGFMSPEAARTFKPGVTSIRVIRLVEDPLVNPGKDEVRLTYEEVGTLNRFGLLDPSSDPRRAVYTLKIGSVAGESGFFVTEAPSALLLSDAGLEQFYDERTIYFWNNQHTALVPDNRYMPVSVPLEQQPTMILNWLVNGPASWLEGVVEDLPAGTAPVGKAPISDDRLQVRLNDKALPSDDTAAALDRLRRQLQWSLRSLLPTRLELTIGHEDPVEYTNGSDFLSSNPASRLAEEPERFVVYAGKIRRLSESLKAVESVPVLEADDNKEVRSAAIATSATHAFAAVVAKSGKNEVLRTTAGPIGEQSPAQSVTGLPQSALGHPTWAVTEDNSADGAVGLVTGNGKLYSFPAGGGRAQQVIWPSQSSAITAITVAPDGNRVAVVAAGKLYRGVLNSSGDGFVLANSQQIRPPGLTTVTAVDFSNEGWVSVAGVRSDGRVAIIDVSIDGALSFERLADLGDKRVTYLTTYPANPLTANAITGRAYSGWVSYSSDGKAWDALSKAQQINAGDVAGGAGNQPAGTVPTEPLFLD